MLFLLFLHLSTATQIMINYYYADSGCTGNPIGLDATASGCSLSSLGPCSNGKRNQCVSSLPAVPSGMIQLTTFSGGSCGTLFVAFYGIPGTCIATASSASYKMICSGSTMTVSAYSSSSTCVGTQSAGFPLTNGGTCATCGGALNCQSSSCTGFAHLLIPSFGLLLLIVFV